MSEFLGLVSDQQLHCTFQTFSVVNILTILTGVGSEIKSMIVLLSPLVCVVVVVVFFFLVSFAFLYGDIHVCLR